VSWRLAGPEIQYIVSHCDATLVFVGPESSASVRNLLPALPLVRRAVAMEGGEPDWPAYTDWRDACPDTPPAYEAKPADVVLQLYTSGTTGRPKGVMLMHRNLTSGTRPRCAKAPTGRNGTTKMCRWWPCRWRISAVRAGACAVFLSAARVSWRANSIRARCSTISSTTASASCSWCRPRCRSCCVIRARQVDYSRLKHMLYGSSPIPAALLREGMAVFGCGFVQQYGMTETTGTIVALPPEDHTPADVLRMRAAGKAMPGSEVAVVGPDGQRLAAGEVGEVVIRSPQNMAGYWKQEEETARTIDADGWLRSGDAGYMDADGYLYIHDRVKDMIISGGENIYPAEVESAIYGHPAVADVAVIGVPDERWGEAVKAMVVLRPVWPLTPTAFWAGRVSASRVSRCPRALTSSMPCRAIRPASCCAGRCGSRTGRPVPGR
jgi:long-chain acyl-CoA synthetase